MTYRDVTVRLRADVSQFQRGVLTASATARGFARDLDTADSKLSNIVQTGLAVAPALVPIAAVGVPAVAGLTSQLGFAVAAAGTTVMAFQGVGDALKALNEYRLAPTAENLAKVREEMAGLGPEGQDFVRFLQDLRPEMQQWQNLAREGLFPGMQEGIEDALKLAPQVEQVISTISSTLGDLMADAGDNLNDQRWVDFFEYLDREAGPTLTAMGRTFGGLVEGFSSMVMGFDPLSDMFRDGMVGAARDFREWSDGLDDNQGFQNFVDYIEENGPRALDTLGALVDAFVSLVQAAAPVGAAALPVIEALAHTLSAVADSPAGPVLIGAAAGISAISRAVALYNAANGSALMGMVTKGKDDGQKAALGWRAAGVGVGLFAASLTDLDDKAGLANTATYALLGTMVAPGWGTAAGTAVGMVMDFAAANNDAEDAVDGLYDAIERGTRGDIRSRMQDVRDQLRETREDMDNFWSLKPEEGESFFEGAKSDMNALVTWITGGENKMRAALTRGRTAMLRTSGSAEIFGESIGLAGDDMAGAAMDAQELSRELAILEGFFDRRAAIRAYEQSLDDFRKELRNGAKEWDVNTTAGLKNEEALDAVGTAMLQVIDKIKSGNVRRSFLVDARRDLVQMREEFPAAAGAIDVVMDKLDRRLTGFAKKKATPKLDADERPLKKKLDTADSWLLNFDHKSPEAKVGADASSAWDVFYKIDQWKPAAKTVHIGVSGAGAVGIGSAHGNFFPASRRYAYGDFANGHQAEMTRPGGLMRVWAEPETRGESYIPHANDGRRSRARAILEETANLFGGTVSYRGAQNHGAVMVGLQGGGATKVIERVTERLPTGPVRLQVEGRSFMATFVDVARDVARGELADDRDLDSTLRGF